MRREIAAAGRWRRPSGPQPRQVVKMLGADTELGNFILGGDPDTDTCREASQAGSLKNSTANVVPGRLFSNPSTIVLAPVLAAPSRSG